MAQSVAQGATFDFVVVGKNRFGTVVPLTDATVTVDVAALGTATVGADGTNGVFTAVGLGDGNLVASAAGKTSAPFPITVVADTVVATVEIQPAIVVQPV